MNCSINELNKKIKDNDIANLYLLYGTETYLKEHYLKNIIDKVKIIQNEEVEVVKISGSMNPDMVYEATETSSMFGGIKIIVINNSGWFKNDAKESFERYGFLTEIKDYLYIIFSEENVAKNKKLYKEVDKNGICTEINEQTPDMKEKWIEAQFKRKRIVINKSAVKYMVNNCEPDFMNLSNEIEKLSLAVDEGNEITINDIDTYCTKIINSKIFALTDNISSRNSAQALKVFNELVKMGEPVERIYFMISRYFKIMKQIKELDSEGLSAKAAGILKINPYEANRFLKNIKIFSLKELKEAVNECMEYDVARKNGMMDYFAATELLIIKYSS